MSVAQGVALQLNTRTSISRRKIDGREALRVLAGEAAVTARGSRIQPFAIEAGVGRTLLTRGVADVQVDREATLVTCLRDQLDLVHPTQTLRLTEGQQASYTDVALTEPRRVDVDVTSAWCRGLLIFRNAPLREVVGQLNRYRSGCIILTSDALARRPVYGVFHVRRIDAAVGQVQALTGAKLTALPGGIVLLS